MDLPNNYFFLLVISDLIFFALGAIIGSLLTYNLSVKLKKEGKRRVNTDKLIRNIIIIIVTIAWGGSILVETIDRTYSPNILVHLIFGMIAGATLDINFSEVLANFGKLKVGNSNQKKNDNGKQDN